MLETTIKCVYVRSSAFDRMLNSFHVKFDLSFPLVFHARVSLDTFFQWNPFESHKMFCRRTEPIK